VIHWGDPAFDLGFALTHFLSKANHLATRRVDLAEAAEVFLVSYFGSIDKGAVWSSGIEPFIIRHTLACLLARVCGRSTLEYLTPTERGRQRDEVLFMMHDQPQVLGDLIKRFIAKVSN
jgi:5-methylthioribose kinase